jgi:hypothetical protein
MGEAKRRAAELARAAARSKPLSAARFNVYAMGTREAPTRLVAQELSYWASADESVLALIFRDRVDDNWRSVSSGSRQQHELPPVARRRPRSGT